MDWRFTVLNLKKKSIKNHTSYMENFTTAGVFNLLSNFVPHEKSHRLPAFYGSSTFDFKNIRKVICGDLKNTSWFVATQYAKCQIPAKKRHSQSQLCSHREHAISALLLFTTFHHGFYHQSAIFHSCESLLFIFQPSFPPRASSTGQLLWKRLREKQTETETEMDSQNNPTLKY